MGRNSRPVLLFLGAALLAASGCVSIRAPGDSIPPGVRLRDDHRSPPHPELSSAYTYQGSLDELDECYEAELMGCDGSCPPWPKG